MSYWFLQLPLQPSAYSVYNLGVPFWTSTNYKPLQLAAQPQKVFVISRTGQAWFKHGYDTEITSIFSLTIKLYIQVSSTCCFSCEVGSEWLSSVCFSPTSFVDSFLMNPCTQGRCVTLAQCGKCFLECRQVRTHLPRGQILLTSLRVGLPCGFGSMLFFSMLSSCHSPYSSYTLCSS